MAVIIATTHTPITQRGGQAEVELRFVARELLPIPLVNQAQRANALPLSSAGTEDRQHKNNYFLLFTEDNMYVIDIGSVMLLQLCTITGQFNQENG